MKSSFLFFQNNDISWTIRHSNDNDDDDDDDDDADDDKKTLMHITAHWVEWNRTDIQITSIS